MSTSPRRPTASSATPRRGGTPFAGGFAFTLPFGKIYSTNITPDKDTGIGNYTDAAVPCGVQRGIRRDGARLYPAMPFASYTYMTDEDVLAIKAYLFSRPAVHAPARPTRSASRLTSAALMAFWSLRSSIPTRAFAPIPHRSAEWNRGAYLAEALAHCGECHTPRNPAFALDQRRKFAGALTGGWYAYNITRRQGLGSRSLERRGPHSTTCRMGTRAAARRPVRWARRWRASFSQMEPADIRALVAYVRSVPAMASAEPATIAPPAPASPKDGVAVADALGRRVFEQACVSCHSWTGVSAISSYATIAGSRAVNDPAATNVAQIVISGTKRHTPPGVVSMPAFGSIYSDTEIAAVVNYVTGRFGSAPSKVTEADVAALRAQASR